jgi:hypothetical protein
MRMPLVRSGGDETPIAWWEWLFAPLLMPLFFVALLVLAVVSIPVEFVYRVRQQREERQFRPRLAAAGRCVEWAEVEARLQAGEGTLIIEHLSPKGPIREWWTEEDVIAGAPVALPSSLASPPPEGQQQAVQEYARACAAKYLDVESGTAKLTEVPVPLTRRLDPRKYVVVHLGGGLMTAILLATERHLAEQYPRGKVVTLIAWFDEPILAVGDAEAVFLGPGNGDPGPSPRRPG